MASTRTTTKTETRIEHKGLSVLIERGETGGTVSVWVHNNKAHARAGRLEALFQAAPYTTMRGPNDRFYYSWVRQEMPSTAAIRAVVMGK